jgi:Tfp pilus assembly protein PilF
MSNTYRMTKLSMALTFAAALAGCNDLGQSPQKVAPVATQLPPPSEVVAPPVSPTTPAPATHDPPQPPPVVADDADDGDADDDASIDQSEALTRARKRLAAGNGEGALRLAKIAVLRTPKRASAWNVLGRAQLVLGKRKDAIASFEKAVELNPESSYARNNLGLALIYEKRFEEAADSLEQAVELEPVEAYMWNNLGMAYEQLDRLDDAREAYEKAVAMDSDRATASLTRLKGVTSVIRTARVETSETAGRTTDGDGKDDFGGKTDEVRKGKPSAIQ